MKRSKKLLQYNKAQQEKFILIRKDLKVIKKTLNELEKLVRKTDVYNTYSFYDWLVSHLVDTSKEIDKKTKKILNEIDRSEK